MQTDQLEFRDYQPDDKATILALLGNGRPANYGPGKQAVFDWQFFANPQAATCRSPFIVGTVRGHIVAVNGLMPVSARVAGERVDACWSLDTYVSGDYRGRGFGKALIAQVSVRAPVMLGFGISDMSDPILVKCDWHLDPTATMFYHANEAGLKGLAKNMFSRVSCMVRGDRERPVAQLGLEATLPAAEVDDLWSRVVSHYPNAVERTAAYLTWRYEEAPVLRYRWVAARQEGELRALLITRHDAIESVLVDYVGPLDEPALLRGLVRFACADLIAQGTRRIRCESNHPSMLGALTATGFRRYRVAGRFRVRSNLGSGTEPLAPWFVMTGDSDNDLLAL